MVRSAQVGSAGCGITHTSGGTFGFGVTVPVTLASSARRNGSWHSRCPPGTLAVLSLSPGTWHSRCLLALSLSLGTLAVSHSRCLSLLANSHFPCARLFRLSSRAMTDGIG